MRCFQPQSKTEKDWPQMTQTYADVPVDPVRILSANIRGSLLFVSLESSRRAMQQTVGNLSRNSHEAPRIGARGSAMDELAGFFNGAWSAPGAPHWRSGAPHWRSRRPGLV